MMKNMRMILKMMVILWHQNCFLVICFRRVMKKDFLHLWMVVVVVRGEKEWFVVEAYKMLDVKNGQNLKQRLKQHLQKRIHIIQNQKRNVNLQKVWENVMVDLLWKEWFPELISRTETTLKIRWDEPKFLGVKIVNYILEMDESEVGGLNYKEVYRGNFIPFEKGCWLLYM